LSQAGPGLWGKQEGRRFGALFRVVSPFCLAVAQFAMQFQRFAIDLSIALQQCHCTRRPVQQLLRGIQMLTLLMIVGAGAAFSIAAIARTRSAGTSGDTLTDI
jgi:hypothetical protein